MKDGIILLSKAPDNPEESCDFERNKAINNYLSRFEIVDGKLCIKPKKASEVKQELDF